MKYGKTIVCNLFLWTIGLTGIQSQEIITTSGGIAVGIAGTVTYTIGQVANISQINDSLIIIEGVQQPFEIFVITNISEASDISISCVIYPNPATEFIVLKVENYNSKNLAFQLYDINGNIFESKNITENETSVSVINLSPSTYLLKITDNNKEIKTFKIIKNKIK